MTEAVKIVCPFCNAPYTEKMLDAYNGTYGCETGCEYMSIVVVCESCGRKVYVKGEFGSFDNDKEKSEVLSEVEAQELIEALQRKEQY